MKKLLSIITKIKKYLSSISFRKSKQRLLPKEQRNSPFTPYIPNTDITIHTVTLDKFQDCLCDDRLEVPGRIGSVDADSGDFALIGVASLERD